MLGWLKCASTSASLWNFWRSTRENSGSSVSTLMSLSAPLSLKSGDWYARYTRPNPPEPRVPTTRKSPTIWPITGSGCSATPRWARSQSVLEI